MTKKKTPIFHTDSGLCPLSKASRKARSPFFKRAAKEVRQMLKFFSLVGPGDDDSSSSNDDDDGCEHSDHSEDSDADSSDTDAG